MMRPTLAALAAAFVLAACGGQDPTVQPEGGPSPELTNPAPVENEIPVGAVEYEFPGVPDELTRGHYTFRLENAGEEPHEFLLFRITTDATVDDLVELPEKDAQAQIEQTASAFAEPGQGDVVEAELEAGRYGYACFVPSPDGQPHALLGMRGELTVV